MELTDLDLSEIARLIKEGNTGGIIDSKEDEISYRINWQLKTDKFEN